MRFVSCSLFLIFFNLGFSAVQDRQLCFEENFDITVVNRSQYFGIIPLELKLTKDKCDLKLTHGAFLRETVWIDICRGPIHIKLQQFGQVEVFKKTGPCDTNPSGQFCRLTRSLWEILENQGLIFAKGERANLKSPHGKTFCFKDLAKGYLDEGKILTWGVPLVKKRPINLLSIEKSEETSPAKLKSEDVVERKTLPLEEAKF